MSGNGVESPDLRSIAGTAARSVIVILDPSSTSAARAEAQNYYDNFRGNAKPVQVFMVGFIMASETADTPSVVHAGLHLVQEVVSYSWSQFTNDERNYLKQVLMELVQNHTSPNFAVYSVPYLQEALAKVIVEIAKKEWPQFWPDLFSDLKSLPESTNLSFLVWRRLSEDVISLQTVDSHDRRSDLSQTLCLHAADVMDFLFLTLKSSHAIYMTAQQEFLKDRIRTILSVVYAYFEWVNTSVILTSGRIGELIQLMLFSDFRFDSCQCLLQLMERKNTRKEPEVTNEFLNELSHHRIVESINACKHTEDDIKFLRKFGEVLVLIGHNVPLNEQSVNFFGNYVMKLALHGDVVGMVSASQAYINFLKLMDQKCREPDFRFLSRLKELISVICQKFCSVVNPDEKSDMNLLKQNLGYLLKTAGKLDQKFYLCVNSWLHQSLVSTIPIPPFQIDVIAYILDVIASSINSEMEDVVQIGLNDLRMALDQFTTEADLALKSSYLSVVSSLFTFLNLAKEQNKFEEIHFHLLQRIFTEMFNCYTLMECGQPERFLRHHVGALMIKLGIRFPSLLSLALDHILALTNSLDGKIKAMEQQSVLESLLIASNSWKDFERQKSFIERTFQLEQWSRMSAIVTSDSFLRFLEEPAFTENKSVFFTNLTLLHNIIRRVRNMTLAGKDEKVHAAYDLCRQVLPVVLQFVKMVHCLLEVPAFATIFDMMESEKIQVLGIMQAPGASVLNHLKNKTPLTLDITTSSQSYLDSVKKFVHANLECAYGILGGSCLLFTPHLYTIPRIYDIYLSHVGWKIESLNDHRVRNIVRSVYRPFLLSCPPSTYESVLLPFIQKLAPYMLERLSERWTIIKAKNENVDEDEGEEEEILQTSVLRLLTRDYLESLQRILEKSNKDNGVPGNLMELDEEMDDGQSMPQTRQNQGSGSVIDLSEAGRLLLRDPICFSSIVNLFGRALNWDDSAVANRAARCLLATFEVVSQNMNLVLAMLTSSLRSVCTWFEHESNVDMNVRLIDLIFKNFHKQEPQIAQIMIEWGAPEEELRNLSSCCSDGVKNDKKRKELIRRLIKNNPILERNKVKKSSWLDQLPPLPKKTGNTDSEMDLTSLFALG